MGIHTQRRGTQVGAFFSAQTQKMVYNNNNNTVKELNDAIKGDFVSNIAPSSVNNSIQPVLNVNPKDYREMNVIRGVSAPNTGTVTVYTTPTNRDFYLCALDISMIKDAACDMTTGNSIQLIVEDLDGASRNLLQFPIITLTAQQSSKSLNLIYPIKLKRGSSILISGTFAAGVCVRNALVVGHIVD